jgi:Protein of unknown function (DUF1348)
LLLFYMSERAVLRPSRPPFDREKATQDVRGAKDWWNTRGPERVSLAYGEQGRCRNRSECMTGRKKIVDERKFHWPLERRPDDHPGVNDRPDHCASPVRPRVRSSVIRRSTKHIAGARSVLPCSGMLRLDQDRPAGRSSWERPFGVHLAGNP